MRRHEIGLGEGRLEPRKSLVDRLPSGRDEVDEHGQVLHAGAPLGEEVALVPLEAANQMPREAPYLRQLTSDRERFRANALADGLADAIG